MNLCIISMCVCVWRLNNFTRGHCPGDIRIQGENLQAFQILMVKYSRNEDEGSHRHEDNQHVVAVERNKMEFFQTEGMSEKLNAADMSRDTSGEMFTEVNK